MTSAKNLLVVERIVTCGQNPVIQVLLLAQIHSFPFFTQNKMYSVSWITLNSSVAYFAMLPTPYALYEYERFKKFVVKMEPKEEFVP